MVRQIFILLIFADLFRAIPQCIFQDLQDVRKICALLHRSKLKVSQNRFCKSREITGKFGKIKECFENENRYISNRGGCMFSRQNINLLLLFIFNFYFELPEHEN